MIRLESNTVTVTQSQKASPMPPTQMTEQDKKVASAASQIYNPALNTVRGTAHIRMLSGKIAELNRALKKCQQEDPLTQSLKEICTAFTKEISPSSDPKQWTEELCKKLKEVLVDDFLLFNYDLSSPLKEPLLGRDGFVYGTGSLALFYAEAPEEYQEVSPITGEPDFYTVPHEAATAAIAWLKEHGDYPENGAINSAYEEYRMSGYFVPLPTPHNQAMRKRLRERVQFIQQQEKSVELLKEQVAVLSEVKREIIEGFFQIQATMDKNEQDLIERLERLETRRKEKAAEFDQQLAALDTQIEEQYALNAQLESEREELAHGIDQAKHEIAQLEGAIREAAFAIKRAKKAREKKMWISCTMAVVQTCIFGTPFLMSVLHGGVCAVADSIRARLGIPKEVATIAVGAIRGGFIAPTNIGVMGGIVRGGALGMTSVATARLAEHSPYCALLADGIQGVAGAVAFTKNPLTSNVYKNMAATMSSGTASRITGIPLSASASNGEMQMNFVVKK